MANDWHKWWEEARKAGYSIYENWHKHVAIINNPSGHIESVFDTYNSNYDNRATQQLLGEYYRDVVVNHKDPHSLGWEKPKPVNGSTPAPEPKNIPTGFDKSKPKKPHKPRDKSPVSVGQFAAEADAIFDEQMGPVEKERTYAAAISEWLASKGQALSTGITGLTTSIQQKKKYAKQVREWRKRALKDHITIGDSGRILPPESISANRYDPTKYTYGEKLNVLDFETVGTDTQKGSILSYAALKVAWNYDTEEYDVISKRTRYYYPTKEDKLLVDKNGVPVYDTSIGINGLTDENIKARRNGGLAKYARHFTDKEKQRLVKWLGDKPVVGHNISHFDWPKLLGIHVPVGGQIPTELLPKGGIIDTMQLAEGTRGHAAGLNTNSTLFQLAYGKTVEEAGFGAHDALEDIQITAKVLAAMRRDKGRMGKLTRFLVKHPGLSTADRDLMIKGITELRGLNPMSQSKLDADVQAQLKELYESQGLDMEVDDVMIEDIARQQFSEVGPGHSARTSREASLQALGIDPSGLTDEIKNLHDVIRDLASTMKEQQRVGMSNNSAIRDAATLPTIAQRKEFLHDYLGLTGDPDAPEWSDPNRIAGLALQRANALYKARHKGVLEAPEAAKEEEEERNPWEGSQWKNEFDKRLYYRSQLAKDRNGEGLSDGGRRNLDYLNTLDIERNTPKEVWGKDPAGFTGSLNFATKALSAFAKGVKEATDAADSIFRTHQKADKSVYNAASYFIPAPLHTAGGKFFEAYQKFEENKYQGAMRFISPIGELSKGGTKGVFGAIGDFANRTIMSKAADKVSRIDLWAGFTELMLVPLKLAGAGLKSLHHNAIQLGKAFLSIIANFRSLGIPLTNLTGVTYADMQRSYTGDAMAGAANGTLNNAYNTFAGAQQDLFSLGQLDTTRVVAAALTGTFGSVYANGGDTQEQYANTVNTIAARIKNTNDPRERQRLMNLAGKIDATMPTVLQQMDNIGVTDFRSIQNGSWLKGRGITQYTSTKEQRAAYTRAGMEFTGLQESIGDTKNVIAERLWSWIGRDVMSAFNDMFRKIANGDWKGAIEMAKAKGREFWARISNAVFGKEVSLGDAFNSIKGGLSSAFGGLFNLALPHLKRAIASYIELVTNAWIKIGDVVAKIADDMVERLKWVKLGIVTDETGTHVGIKTLKASDKSETELHMPKGSSAQNFGTIWASGVTVAEAREAYANAHGKTDLKEDDDLFNEPLDNSYFQYTVNGPNGPEKPATFNDIVQAIRNIQGMIEYGGLGAPGDLAYDNAYNKLFRRNMRPGFILNSWNNIGKPGLQLMGNEAADQLRASADLDEKRNQSATFNFDFGNLGSMKYEDGKTTATGAISSHIKALGMYVDIDVNGAITNLGSQEAQ